MIVKVTNPPKRLWVTTLILMLILSGCAPQDSTLAKIIKLDPTPPTPGTILYIKPEHAPLFFKSTNKDSTQQCIVNANTQVQVYDEKNATTSKIGMSMYVYITIPNRKDCRTNEFLLDWFTTTPFNP